MIGPRASGMRGLVIKDHNEPTAPLAYHLRQVVPDLELYGGFVLNLPNGGANPPGVEFMATQIRGEPGRIVWMPAGDTEKEVRESKNPNGPYVAVSRNGELLPEVKQVISIIAKHDLTLASGHILADEALAFCDHLVAAARRPYLAEVVAYERAMIELKRPRPGGAPRPSQRVVFQHDPARLLPPLARGERPRRVPRRRHVAIGFLGADGEIDWRIEGAVSD